jgi:hypothetical protein
MDAIDPSAVTWHGVPNPGAWPITRTLAGVEFDDRGPEYGVRPITNADTWPEVVPTGWDGPIVYSVWFFRQIAGRWHGTCCLEFYLGKQWTGAPLGVYYDDWINPGKGYGEMEGLGNVRVGERIGFMIAAGSQRLKDTSTQPGRTSPRERTPIIVVAYVGKGIQMAGVTPPTPEPQPQPTPEPQPGQVPPHTHPDLVSALDKTVDMAQQMASALSLASQEIVTLRARVETLEALSARVDALEQRPLPTLPTSIRIFGVTVPVTWR